jgi:putative ABC transport system substrate-binding protein
VFVGVSDPIGSGFVENLAQPGGNLTGLMQYEEGIAGKWLAMLKEIAPHLTRIALLVANPTTGPYGYFVQTAETAAAPLAIKIFPTPITTAIDIVRSIESFSIRD